MKKVFEMGQEVIWHIEEFGKVSDIKAIITEVHSDHYIARTVGNDFNNYNDMNLYIDEDTEVDFFAR